MSEFEKGQIVASNDYGLWFYDIVKKLNHHYSLIDVFLKNCQAVIETTKY